ncbi:hypothetical protein L3Q65_01130 (plasmid) [Amycolatopsis sp. FU40]|uniref:hypothetical protein n=1 Tax=Amycolatopsis sp. FU40 TaxID=2914159 RepID=UPI001F1C222C|nr:hypothetical protein [Amycolatopsis sp. FU40]UKD50928.1 hypothetical protein L3Q65_01130 [Amycolatopsis sp. FU40]
MAHWKHGSLPAFGCAVKSWLKIGPVSTLLNPAAMPTSRILSSCSPESIPMTQSNVDRDSVDAAAQPRDLKLVGVSEDNELVCPHCGAEAQIFAEEECNRHSSVSMTGGGERAVITAGETAFDHVRFFCENCQRDVELPRSIRPRAL